MLADSVRKQLAQGIDPIEARQAAERAVRIDAARTLTFRQAAEAYIAVNRSVWRNAEHARQWPSTLEAYAYPVFGDLPVASVDVNLVRKALAPIWQTKAVTAGRVRGRIERILDWATASELRTGDNPARWNGPLRHLLPRAKPLAAKHHASLPYAEMPSFMAALRSEEGVAARALEFTILTAARIGEVLYATWNEIDMNGAIWAVPPERIKAHRLHRVPLSEPALVILQAMGAVGSGSYVFPGVAAGRPVNRDTSRRLLERMGHGTMTSHGFRATFRTWAQESTNFPRDVAELALAHATKDRTESAYARSDLLEKRRLLMDAWARHCGTPVATTGQVVQLHHTIE
jgi:integrase